MIVWKKRVLNGNKVYILFTCSSTLCGKVEERKLIFKKAGNTKMATLPVSPLPKGQEIKFAWRERSERGIKAIQASFSRTFTNVQISVKQNCQRVGQ